MQADLVVHATTLFTNALIERKGAPRRPAHHRGLPRRARDRHGAHYDIYDLAARQAGPAGAAPPPGPVRERIGADGSVVAAPRRRRRPRRRRAACATAGVRSIAIVFLNAYGNPAHESRAPDPSCGSVPGIAVCTSSEVAPEIREYERTSTTVANAYVKPIAARYLRRARAHSLGAPLFVMLSDGGLTTATCRKPQPIALVESGPAAARWRRRSSARQAGWDDVLAFDMGGTTAKLSLVDDGEPLIAYGFEAARQKRFIEGSGLPIRLLDDRADRDRRRRRQHRRRRRDRPAQGRPATAPAPSRARPATAAAARQPTVTDANLLLGYLDPDFFAGGTHAIDRDAADAAIAGLAEPLGLDAVRRSPPASTRSSTRTWRRAARVHIAERGRDPRRYALVCTGGGGPVHGYGVARQARHCAADLPPRRRRRLGLRPAGRAGAGRPGHPTVVASASTPAASPISRRRSWTSSKKRRERSSRRPGRRWRSSSELPATAATSARVSIW